MIGIYKIRNKLTNQCYIGQSKDIEKRWREHIHHKNTLIGSDIETYGLENFEFSVVKECEEEELDYYEIYYIKEFDSMRNGYNQNPGGSSLYGEANPNSKLTEQEVYEIREAYNNHENKNSVYVRFKDRITFLSFSDIWQGRSWMHVHMDVYTLENKQYYMKETSLGENGKDSIFTNYEVINMRYMYIDKTAREIYQELNLSSKCEFQTLQQILWGRSYSHLPIYNKKKRVWENVEFVV